MDVAPNGKAIPQPKRKARRRGPRLTGVSKQRRVANARERRRVEILNMNIQILRHMIPLPPQDKEPSKTEVIWLAVDYITELMKMLESAGKWEGGLDMIDVDSLDSLDSLDDSPLFNFEGKFLWIRREVCYTTEKKLNQLSKKWLKTSIPLCYPIYAEFIFQKIWFSFSVFQSS